METEPKPNAEALLSTRLVVESIATPEAMDGANMMIANVGSDVSLYDDGRVSWHITGNNPKDTTYVTGYGGVPTTDREATAGPSSGAQTYDYPAFATASTVAWFAVVAYDDVVTTDKTVDTVAEETDEFTLTLEAFASGSTLQIAKTKPADIVLVLDQSSSMYTPVGVDADRISIDVEAYKNNPYSELTQTLIDTRSALSSYAINDFVTKVNDGDPTVLNNAKQLGYYVAIHNKYNYIYIVQYAQNKAGEWGWYYVPVDSTVRTVEVDTENSTPDTGEALKDGFDSGSEEFQPFGYGTYAQEDKTILSNVTYYQTQYGALYDTLQQFVSDLKDEAANSGLDHRVAVVGFASPFYDGWTGYDGTGIYVDGNYYLYDSDYKYVKNGVTYDPDKVFGASEDKYDSTTEMGDGKYHKFNVSNDTYAKALVSVKDQVGYESVMKSVKAYKANYQQTCPSIGIAIAQSIFAARTGTEELFTTPALADKFSPGSPTYGNNGDTYAEDQNDEHLKSTYMQDNAEERDEIIVLFTDGVPTVRCSSDRDLGQSAHHAVKAEFWSIEAGIDDVIDHAYEAKQAGIQIYGIGTSKAVMTQYGSTFFEHVSSDDPTALSTLKVNEVWIEDSEGKMFLNGASASVAISNSIYTKAGYTMYTSDPGTNLGEAFNTVYESIVEMASLDEKAVMKEVLSDYFDLANLSPDALLDNISVYTADYLGG